VPGRPTIGPALSHAFPEEPGRDRDPREISKRGMSAGGARGRAEIAEKGCSQLRRKVSAWCDNAAMELRTADSIAAAAAALERGATVAQAAAEAGVHRRTVERWRRRGEGELTPFARLAAVAAKPSPAAAGPVTEAELVALLEREARHGRIRAIELLLERIAARRVAREDNPFAEVIDLARRRPRNSS
jgi:transposase-like protein